MQKKTQEQFNHDSYEEIKKMIESRSKKYHSFLEQMTLSKGRAAIDVLISDFYADVFQKKYIYFFEKWCIDKNQFRYLLSSSIKNFFVSKHRSLSRKFYSKNIYDTIKDVVIEIGEEKKLAEKPMAKDNIVSLLTEETMGIDIFSLLAESKTKIVTYSKNKKGNKINKINFKKFLKEELMPLCNDKINIGEIKEAILKCHPSLGPSHLQVDTQNDETQEVSNDIDIIIDKQKDQEFGIDSLSDLNPVLCEMNVRLELNLFREKLKKQNQNIEEKIFGLHIEEKTIQEISELLIDEGIELNQWTVWRKLNAVIDQWRKHIKN
ncbi:MAG: hypothetical protein HQK75_13770 [Candidatus Magnetomorum sp.]|nr:hypothetical protein [Candidatus Magnetomorum sp.]